MIDKKHSETFADTLEVFPEADYRKIVGSL